MKAEFQLEPPPPPCPIPPTPARRSWQSREISIGEGKRSAFWSAAEGRYAQLPLAFENKVMRESPFQHSSQNYFVLPFVMSGEAYQFVYGEGQQKCKIGKWTRSTTRAYGMLCLCRFHAPTIPMNQYPVTLPWAVSMVDSVGKGGGQHLVNNDFLKLVV